MIWFEDTTDNNRRVLCKPMDLFGYHFGSMNQALLAYENGEITLHQNIYVYRKATLEDGTEVAGFVYTTLGLLIFNEIIPQDLGFVDRSNPENALKLEIDFRVGKKQIKQILEKVINIHGATKTAEVLDDVKAMGYGYSTRAAMTVSISDMTVPPQKPQMIEDAQNTVDRITRQYKRGLITEEERYKEVVETWKETDDELTKALLTGLDKYNNIFMMADSEPVVPISRSNSLPECEDLWRIQPVERSSCLLSQTSEMVLTYSSTSCLRMELEKVCPILLFVQPIPDT